MDYVIDIEGEGRFTISLSKAKALPIISELNRRLPLDTYMLRRGNRILIYLGIDKGGFSMVSCEEGRVLYDVVQDSLMICLSSERIESRKFIDVGYVKEGLEKILNLDRKVKVRIERVE